MRLCENYPRSRAFVHFETEHDKEKLTYRFGVGERISDLALP